MKRDVNIDLLKIISCIGVVGLHSIPRNINTFNMMLYCLCSFSIPMFFLTFGYQFGNRKNIRCGYIAEKIINILGLILIWNGIIAVIEKDLFPTGVSFTWGGYLNSVKDSIIQAGLGWQMWYLWCIIGIYLLMSLWTRMKKRSIILGIVMLIILGEIIQILYYAGYNIYEKIPQTFRYWIWMKYFLIGIFLKLNDDFFTRLINKMTSKIILSLLTISSILFLLWMYICNKFVVDIKTTEYFYDDLVLVIWVVCIYVAFKKINLNKYIHLKTIIEKYVQFILGIYIIHPLTMRLVQNYIGISSTVRGICFWIYGCISTLIICIIISKIPYIKCIISINWKYKRKKVSN